MIVLPLSRELTRELLLLSRHLVRWGRVIILSRGHGVADRPHLAVVVCFPFGDNKSARRGDTKEIKQTFTYGAQKMIFWGSAISLILQTCFRPSKYVRR